MESLNLVRVRPLELRFASEASFRVAFLPKATSPEAIFEVDWSVQKGRWCWRFSKERISYSCLVAKCHFYGVFTPVVWWYFATFKTVKKQHFATTSITCRQNATFKTVVWWYFATFKTVKWRSFATTFLSDEPSNASNRGRFSRNKAVQDAS